MEAAISRDKGIFHPVTDFLAVGGFSFLLLPFIWIVGNDTLKTVEPHIAWTAYLIGFFINWPHFAYSYQLLYRGFGAKLKDKTLQPMNRLRYLIAGVIAPVALVVWFAWGLAEKSTVILGYTVNAMYFFVGWHYIKQGYGILIVLAGRQKIFFTDMERRLLLIHAYAVWIVNWIKINAYNSTNNFTGIPYTTFDMPDPLVEAGKLALPAIAALLGVSMTLKFVTLRRAPPLAAFSGYFAALYLWTMFPYTNVIFTYLVPAFHSLQYIVFVWKLETEKSRDTLGVGDKVRDRSKILKFRWHMAQFMILGGILGVLGFLAIPTGLDRLYPTFSVALGTQAFLFAFTIFINIHHYFIDTAIWRRDNPELKYLFK